MGRLTKLGIDARQGLDSFCYQVALAHVQHNPGDPAPPECVVAAHERTRNDRAAESKRAWRSCL